MRTGRWSSIALFHHADQNFLDGPVAEPVDDALHGFRRHPTGGSEA